MLLKGTKDDKIAAFHIVRDWSEFYECRTKFFNMAIACGCSTTKMKTDNEKEMALELCNCLVYKQLEK